MTKAFDIITYYVKMFGKLVFYGWLVWFRHIWPIALLYQILEESDRPISVGASGTGIVRNRFDSHIPSTAQANKIRFKMCLIDGVEKLKLLLSSYVLVGPLLN